MKISFTYVIKTMKKFLFATTNQQKVKRLNFLTKIKFISLSDLKYKIKKLDEFGKDALDISILKARYYYSSIKEKMPVLTQDDTLRLQVKPEDSPGNHIKIPVIEKYGKFTDETAIKYYTSLAKKYGGTIPMYFEYGHALCFSDGEECIRARKSRLEGRLVDLPQKNKSTKGYFLSAIVQVKIKNGWKYYSELTPKDLITIDSGISESLKKLLI